MDFTQYGPWAFLAGGSEGVGASFARVFAAHGINLVIAARKPDPIHELAEQIRKEFGVEVRELPLDLCASDMLDKVKAATSGVEIGMLVYNAGAETQLKPFLDRPVESSEMMIALNVIGPTRLAHLFGTGMRERGQGGMIIVGSGSGHMGSPRQVVYSAAKAYEFNLAEGLWCELQPEGIHVLGLILGLTKTPNLLRSGMRLDIPGYEAAEPDDVVRQALEVLGKEPILAVGGWTENVQQRRGLPRLEAMKLAGLGLKALKM